MTNLWEFLLQTAYVSLVGVLLLVVKWLLRDKLSPRWQYSVWVVLAARLLVPATLGGGTALLPLSLWVEMAQLTVEQRLSSAYTSIVQSVQVKAPVPWLTGLPHSLTDWLFLLYVLGVVAFLLRYLLSYLSLRQLVQKGEAPSEDLRRQVMGVGEKYGLPLCSMVVLPGLTSPMVCGVFRPVLALPAGKEVEDHVILHELLHVKYRDALQNVFWSLCRAVHWCNPLVHLLLDRVGNDLESLCDQRVLERLAGEERRSYGISLLSMASEKYPRAPGTTSVSNGGRNIARRIEAIVRFKTYPRGMALASCCITLLLLVTCLTGTAAEPAGQEQTDGGSFIRTLANARLNHCTTVAGAVDAYAKGLVEGSRLYLMAASPAGVRMGLMEEYRQLGDQFSLLEGEELPFYLVEMHSTQAPVKGEGTTACTFTKESYGLCRLREEDDGSTTALLVLAVEEQAQGSLGRPGLLVCPIRVYREAGQGYVVEQTGERTLYLSTVYGSFYSPDMGYPFLPADKTYQAQGESGQGQAALQQVYAPESWAELEHSPDYDKTDWVCWRSHCVTYTFAGTAEDRESLTTLALQAMPVASGEEADFSALDIFGPMAPGSVGSSSNGAHYSCISIDEGWDGKLTCSDGSLYDEKEDLPEAFALRVLWNDQVKETMTLKEAANDGV